MRRNTWNKDITGKTLYEGDMVLFNVRRVTIGGSGYGQFTSTNDGWYRIPGTIRFVDGLFRIIGEERVVEQLRRVKGRETFCRGIWFDEQDLHDTYYGNVQKIKEKGTIAPISLGQKWPEHKKPSPTRVAKLTSRYDIIKKEAKR